MKTVGAVDIGASVADYINIKGNKLNIIEAEFEEEVLYNGVKIMIDMTMCSVIIVLFVNIKIC